MCRQRPDRQRKLKSEKYRESYKDVRKGVFLHANFRPADFPKMEFYT